MVRSKQNIWIWAMGGGDNEFICQKFDYSTADIESNVFFGDSSGEILPEPEESGNIKGIFRLINGSLHEMINVAPPNVAPIQKSSGLFKLAGF